MSAYNRPRGFEVKGAIARSNLYVASSAIFPGDMVIFDAANPGQVKSSAGGAAEQLLGVCLGKVQLSQASPSPAIGAGDSILVCDHPDQLYVVQAVAGQVVDATSPLHYAEVSNAIAGSTQFNQSRQQLTGISTTATLPLRITQLDTNVGNDTNATTPNQVVVAINTPALN